MSSEAEALTAEDIVDTVVPYDVKISSSGERIVYWAKPYGHKGDHALSSIWLAEYGKENSAHQITSGLYCDTSPQWAPDGQSIAFVSDRHKAGDSSAIYILSLKMGEPYAITPVENKKAISAFIWSPDGNYISYLSPDEKTSEKKKEEEDKDDAKVYGADWEMNRLRLVHVATRAISVLYRGDLHAFSHAWSPDSKQLVYTLHENPVFDEPMATGTRVELLTIANSKKRAEALYKHPSIMGGHAVGWGPDGIYFISGVKHSSSSWGGLWHLSIDTKEAARVAYGDVDDNEGFKANKDFVCSIVKSGLNEDLRIYNGPTVYTGGKEIGAWDVLKTGQDSDTFAVAITVSSPAKPFELYSVDPSTHSLTQLSYHGAKVTAANLGTAHSLACRSYDDKVPLEGHYITPGAATSVPSCPLPTFVMVHGGPTFRQTESFIAAHNLWMPYILAGGKYGVLTPNYRGNCSYGDAYSAHVRGAAGTLEHDDVLALVDEGIARGFVDKHRVLIGGWFYGGLLSYLAAARNGRTFAGEPKDWRYCAAIPGAGVADWDTMAYTTDIVFFQNEMTGASPWCAEGIDDTRGRKGSAVWEMARSGRQKGANGHVPPCLLLHGEADPRVPVSQAWAFQRAARHYGVDCEMVTYPREGHEFAERAHLVDMLKRVRRFADLHLG